MSQPLWVPGAERVERANLSRFLKFALAESGDPDILDYPNLHHLSVTKPELFWTLVWDFCGIKAQGERVPVVLDSDRMPGARWFPNVRLNFAQNLLRFDDERVALLFRGEHGATERITYAQLRRRVAALTQALQAQGVTLGDRVVGLLPNLPDAVVAMLATASLGAVWSCCAPDTHADDVVERFGQLGPKVLFTAVSGQQGGQVQDWLEKVRGIVACIDAIECVVVLPCLEKPGSLDAIPRATHLDEFVAPFAEAGSQFVPTPFDHPLCITFRQAAGGMSEGIVHGAGGTLIQHLKEHVLHADVKREDKLLIHTKAGGMMWHWLVSALAVGATVVLYDGDPLWPDGNALWNLVDEFGITILGADAEWISAIEKAGVKPRETHKLLALKTILSSGMPLAREGYEYVYREVKDRLMLSTMSGKGEIIGCFALGAPILPVWRGELQCPGLGMRLEMRDETGKSVVGRFGELVCVAPFPSMPVAFWNDPDGVRYRAAYFEKHPGALHQGDIAMLTEHDGVAMRDSSGEMDDAEVRADSAA